ncbi:hypothetical protein BC939DRAFT_85558 [Gamsiella multidivaricata]|uniref:uncharacterized protein n=1 Tax=Gamsiella multidivaricata TaxID=101098 RepID=UPI00221F02D1|nr:uncharacterized protein BC939DRAFT_85558 [Gamsiella multidivaricata]KAI7827625.1 hypothetical protein BC939DRAFT_85558 [Gamsiella multidivaricata]
MTTASAKEKVVQSFREHTTSTTINSATRVDRKTGARIVLWRDIQIAFSNVLYVMDGRDLMPFLKDDNFDDLLPLRIIRCPGVVLNVVTASPGHAIAATSEHAAVVTAKQTIAAASEQSIVAVSGETIAAASEQAITSVQDVCTLSQLNSRANDPTPVLSQAIARYTHPRGQESADSSLDSQCTSSHSISISSVEAVKGGQLVRSSAEAADGQQLTVQLYAQLYTAYVEATMSGLTIEADIFRSELVRRFGPVTAQIESRNIVQVQMLQTLQQILSRQAILENQMQAGIAQAYELHEYPISRMFVVLPKPKRRRNKFTNPLTAQFRLLFLCECGAHTMKEGGTIPHEIHLAKHEGYDIERPNEFFRRYGLHALTIMKVLQYSIYVTGMAIPSLAYFKLAEGLDSIRNGLGGEASNIGHIIEDAINFIQNSQDNAHSGNGESPSWNEVEALEGADLRQLESFLRTKNKDRALGNLFRTTTYEGHAKWVCSDHYRANYQRSNMLRFKDVVMANDGEFIEDIGRLPISIGSSIIARQFYEALTKARGIQTLGITLKWNATLEDFRALAIAINKTNIASLEMEGWYCKVPALDFINNGRRYDPIMEMMSNGRISSLKLKGFEDFYQRISGSSIGMVSRLQSLKINTDFDPSNRLCTFTLARILKHSPVLSELEIFTSHLHDSFIYLKYTVSNPRNLKKWILDSPWRTLRVMFAEGTIQAVDLELWSAAGIEEQKLLQLGCVTHLSVLSHETDQATVIDILRNNPSLSTLDFKCDPRAILHMESAVISVRTTMLSQGHSCSLKTASLMKDPRDELEFTVTLDFRDSLE